MATDSFTLHSFEEINKEGNESSYVIKLHRITSGNSNSELYITLRMIDTGDLYENINLLNNCITDNISGIDVPYYELRPDVRPKFAMKDDYYHFSILVNYEGVTIVIGTDTVHPKLKLGKIPLQQCSNVFKEVLSKIRQTKDEMFEEKLAKKEKLEKERFEKEQEKLEREQNMKRLIKLLGEQKVLEEEIRKLKEKLNIA